MHPNNYWASLCNVSISGALRASTLATWGGAASVESDGREDGIAVECEWTDGSAVECEWTDGSAGGVAVGTDSVPGVAVESCIDGERWGGVGRWRGWGRSPRWSHDASVVVASNRVEPWDARRETNPAPVKRCSWPLQPPPHRATQETAWRLGLCPTVGTFWFLCHTRTRV